MRQINLLPEALQRNKGVYEKRLWINGLLALIVVIMILLFDFLVLYQVKQLEIYQASLAKQLSLLSPAHEAVRYYKQKLVRLRKFARLIQESRILLKQAIDRMHEFDSLVNAKCLIRKIKYQNNELLIWMVTDSVNTGIAFSKILKNKYQDKIEFHFKKNEFLVKLTLLLCEHSNQ